MGFCLGTWEPGEVEGPGRLRDHPDEQYRRLGRTPEQVSPIRGRCDVRLEHHGGAGTLDGFASMDLAAKRSTGATTIRTAR